VFIQLEAMIAERLGMKFFVQCDTQIARQDSLVELLGRAGCFQMFVGAESFDRQTLLAAHKGQNRPETYHDIVRLCRGQGIGSHFSNIIGFPQDTEQKIQEHLTILRDMNPSWASFYILCPIPGTEQYDDFLSQGLITEKNLDRFDTTCLTWQHPSLSRDQLANLLFECYRRFFSIGHSLDSARTHCFQNGRLHLGDTLGSLAMSLFVRYSAWQRTHPMSGGVARVQLDHVDEYMPLRKATFDLEFVPLPRSLQLPETELKLNKTLAPGRTPLNSKRVSTS